MLLSLATVLSISLFTGCAGAGGPRDTLDPVAAVAQGIVDFANAQDTHSAVVSTNGCLPIDYYAGGANTLIRKTEHGCEWISYSETGRELAHGTVALAK